MELISVMTKLNTYFLKDLLPVRPATLKSKTLISGYFPRNWTDFQLHVCQSCSSSLDTAWELIRQKQMHPGDSVLCLKQSRGRGRMGRTWHSALGDILAAWMIPGPSSGWQNTLLSLIVGLSLRQSMQSMGITLSIKWPNDLIHDHQKVCGILIEEKLSCLTAGIGINLAPRPDYIRLNGHSPVKQGSLGNLLPPEDLVRIWAKLVYHAHFWYDDILCNYSLIDFAREINSYLWMIGQKVIAESDQVAVKGVLRGMGDNGELLIENSSGLVSITGGSLRKCE